MAAVTVGSHKAVNKGGRWGGALSSGQFWVMANDTVGDDLHFFYSNDSGATWAEDTAAEITDGDPDADNASLFIDSNDVLWLIYLDAAADLTLQRGTVSGNAITWTDLGVVSGSDTPAPDNPMPDIVAFAEGSNTRVFWAFRDTFNNLEVAQALYSGTLGSITAEVSDSDNNYWSVLGLDFNHTGDGKTVQGSAPHVWVVYTGTTSLYVRKLVWSAGPSWSSGTRRTMSSTIVGTASLHNGFGFWDGTRFVCGGLQADGDIEVYERDSGDTATTDRTPGTQPTGRATADDYFDGYYDQTTDDIYVLLDNTSAQPSYAKYDRAGNSWDAAVTVIEAEACIGKSWLRNEAGGIGNELIALWETSTPTVRTETGVISFNTAPTAPTIDSPATGSVQDVDEALTIDWTFNDPDPGDTQSAYTVRRDIGGTVTYWNGTTWQASEDASTKISSATTQLAMASSWGADGDANHKYAVKTWDAADAGPSSWSTEITVIPSAQDNPSITSPVEAGTPTVDATHTVTWTVSTQTKYRVVVSDTSSTTNMNAGTLEYDSGIQVSASTSQVATFPTNSVTRYVRVQTWNDEGLASDIDEHDVSVSFTPPSTPTLVATADSPTGAIDINITNPGGGATVDYNDIYRRETAVGGSGIRIATQIAASGDFDDWSAASGVAYEYLVRAYAVTTAATADSAWTA